MYIPDLFGAYIKGRELAIEKNWQDLKNYEAIEHARNQNDLEALQILGERADFGGKRSMFQDNVDQSKRNNEIAEYAQPGLASKADMLSRAAQVQRGVYLENEPLYGQVLNSLFQAQLGNQGVSAGVQNYANSYFTPERQYNAGQAKGQAAYNTAVANGVASTDYVSAAQRQIAQNQANHGVNMATTKYQLGDINNAIANQKDINALNIARVSNAQLGQDIARQDMMNQIYSAYIANLQAAQAGDQMAAQAASRLEEQYGFSPPTDPTGNTLIPTPAQQVANAQVAANNQVNQLREQLAINNPYLAAPQPLTNTPATKAPLIGGALGITGTIPRP